MKKLLTALLVVTIVLAMAAPAFAAEANGTITINGVGTDATYEIYKLLDLESYDPTSGAYSYKVNAAWVDFVNTDAAKAYLVVDEAGYVTWVNGDNDAAVAAFAKMALAYAQENGIAPVQSSSNEGEFVITDKSGKFSNLELGWYLVDSTVGALCGLTTTNPNASINAKNGVPTIDKQVEEDSTNQWGDQNTADVGQTVNFRTTINVHAGAQNYVLRDKMSSGLTFDANSVKVTHIQTSDGVTSEVDPSNFTVVTEGLDDDCTFEVRFTQAFCDSLETNDKVIVFYSAMLNRNAIVASDGNPNESWLEYGEEHNTTHDTTKTYTFGFDIIKTDSQNTLIDGAEFKIYDALTGGKEIGVVLMDDGVTYRRARADEEADGLTVPIVVEDGKVRVVGFDNGTYYLEETGAPEGYNKLTARQRFIIADSNLDSVFNDGIYSTGSGVHVVNKTGSMLPETGGLGTTLFILIGGVMVMFAGVVLVSKKRLSKVAE